jgi:hypothetical protein
MLEELAIEAGFTGGDYNNPALYKIIKKFAELVREDERNSMASICRDAIEREREMCARFCDRAAKSIRAKNKVLK